ncbi:MAG: beta-lactamase family protein [Ilumatobacteraceae bacterium]|nr:beta-lactamase family protein [Ilumatobacteraceae bacterium]
MTATETPPTTHRPAGPTIERDPLELGFDPGRLSRIDRHFQQYVDDGRLVGWQLAVSRHGDVAHHATYGSRDADTSAPFAPDSIVRMFSMTKPITSVAALMLHEEGAFQLKDPIKRWLPEFADMRVLRGGSSVAPITEPATEPIRVWHLLTHTSGLTYGFHNSHVSDALYRKAGFEWGSPPDVDLAGCCEKWAELPLAFHPGQEWLYGVSTDVLGRLVEVISGQSLAEFFAERILGPLGMVDTAFHVPDDKRDRLASLYIPTPGSGTAMPAPGGLDRVSNQVPRMLSGGGGLVGTAADYLRFCHMLLNGGELDGVRILGTRTVKFMAQNHIPGNADLEQYGRPLFAETSFDGVGFGLGFSVTMDPVHNKVLDNPGEYAWGGAASTAFWIDPVDEIVAVFLTQLLPSSTHPIRPEFKTLVYQALID